MLRRPPTPPLLPLATPAQTASYYNAPYKCPPPLHIIIIIIIIIEHGRLSTGQVPPPLQHARPRARTTRCYSRALAGSLARRQTVLATCFRWPRLVSQHPDWGRKGDSTGIPARWCCTARCAPRGGLHSNRALRTIQPPGKSYSGLSALPTQSASA
jgi:hypothetical protein